MPPKPLSSASAGPMGCVVLKATSGQLGPKPLQQGVRVEVLNVLGAGDASCRVCCAGWLNDERPGAGQAVTPTPPAGRWVVSRHGCAPAMPTKVELDDYLQRAESVPRPDARRAPQPPAPGHQPPPKRAGAVHFRLDHRKQLADLARETGRDEACIPAAPAVAVGRGLPKRRRRRQVSISAAAFWPTAPPASVRSTPLPARAGGRAAHRTAQPATAASEHGNIGSQLIDWPLEHVVKCLGLLITRRPGGAACRAGRPAARGSAGL